MGKILFNGSPTVYDGALSRCGSHVVAIKFPDAANLPSDSVIKSGFELLNEHNGIVQGDFTDYVTIYRSYEDDPTKVELSNDGSIYVPPKPPAPPVPPAPPTLQEVQEMKVTEMNSIQQAVIQNGVDVTLTDETHEHFTLTPNDQISLMGLQTQVLAGSEKIPWHTEDQNEPCKYYSNEDMKLITTAAMAFVTFHVTYFRDLRKYIRALESIEEVQAITYGVEIPEEYQSEPLKDMLAAQKATLHES